jgi:hypothetical protein
LLKTESSSIANLSGLYLSCKFVIVTGSKSGANGAL